MHKFADCIEFGVIGNSLFNKIFHSLNIVVSRALNLFNAQRLLKGEIIHQLLQHAVGSRRKRRHFRDSGMLREVL